ncbi:MAG: rod shape-determining protein MreD [Deltaproteobacteria bacterium]|nr:rod shape-determining protein MreD [Deltaproteobacteria bacterium]
MSRAILFCLVGFGLLLVQSTLRQLLPVVALVPDPALLLVLYLGLTPRQSAWVGAILAIVLGYLTDLLGAAPKGLHALVYVLLFYAARGAQIRLLTRGWIFEVWFCLLAAFLGGFLVMLGRALAAPAVGVRGYLVAVLQAAATAATAPVVFFIGRRIDRWTSRVPDGHERDSLKVPLK